MLRKRNMKCISILFTAGMLLLLLACAFVVRAEDEGAAPHTKPDGTKYRFSYVDYDEYLPASRSLYYILAGLEENGWISEGSLPCIYTSAPSICRKIDRY